MKKLEGKVIIVTGAAQGQGEVEARYLAENGAQVILTDIQTEPMEKIVKEINDDKETEYEANFKKLDVSNEDDWKDVVAFVIDKYGKIDGLVNNAAYLNADGYQTIEEIDEEEWDKTMTINAKGNFFGVKHVGKHMVKAESGSIVNISSISGIIGGQDGADYTASKGATRLLTKSAAYEYGPHNVRVNSIHPGYINTEMMQSVFTSEEVKKKLLDPIPMKRVAEPIEIATVVGFLLSEESSYVNGTEIIVDGGLTTV